MGCPAVSSSIPGCTETDPERASAKDFIFGGCSTPTVTSISPNNGTVLDEITLTGTGFGTSKCQSEVLIGGKTCSVLSSSDSVITCQIDEKASPKAGVENDVSVHVMGRGDALMSLHNETQRMFLLHSFVASINPDRGSMKGGTDITITGSGFSEGETEVLIKKTPCDIVSLTYSRVVCKTRNRNKGKFPLSVSVNGRQSLCQTQCEYTYSPDATPQIDSVSPKVVSNSGTKVTIFGKGFGEGVEKIDRLLFGSEPCSPTSVSDSQIVCTSGNVGAGTNYIILVIGGKGRATSKTITGKAVVDSMEPAQGHFLIT